MDNELLKVISSLLDEKLQPIKEDISNLNEKLKYIRFQQQEGNQILKSLEHSPEAKKAEHDELISEIAHLSEQIESMRRDLSTLEIITARNMESIAQLKIKK